MLQLQLFERLGALLAQALPRTSIFFSPATPLTRRSPAARVCKRSWQLETLDRQVEVALEIGSRRRVRCRRRRLAVGQEDSGSCRARCLGDSREWIRSQAFGCAGRAQGLTVAGIIAARTAGAVDDPAMTQRMILIDTAPDSRRRRAASVPGRRALFDQDCRHRRSSHVHAHARFTEDALADPGLPPAHRRARAAGVLIGGLGLGLRWPPRSSRWATTRPSWSPNSSPASSTSGTADRSARMRASVNDPRGRRAPSPTSRACWRAATQEYGDAVMLDVDNGPDGLTHASNAWIYGSKGPSALYAALLPGGVATVWSAGPDRRLTTAGPMRLRSRSRRAHIDQRRARAHLVGVAQRSSIVTCA